MIHNKNPTYGLETFNKCTLIDIFYTDNEKFKKKTIQKKSLVISKK